MKRWPIVIALVLMAVLLMVAVGCAPAKPPEQEVAKPPEQEVAKPSEHEIVNLEVYASSPTVAPPYTVAIAHVEILNQMHP